MLRYLRGQRRDGERVDVGHNPMGSWSVLAMLALLIAQVATGLVADDEIANTGPLNRHVANATGLLATAWHKGWGQGLLLGLAALHVLAIGIYRFRGTDLIRPMLHGDKPLPAHVTASRDSVASRALALALAAAWAALAVWVARQGG